jgi:hypothetical protein
VIFVGNCRKNALCSVQARFEKLTTSFCYSRHIIS